MSAVVDCQPPRPAFDALLAHDAQRLTSAVAVLHVYGREPDYGALRRRMQSLASMEGDRDARAEVIGAAERKLREHASAEELPKVLNLLQWVSEQARGSTKKGATPCASQ